MAEIKFEIKETIGVLSESTKGWTKELSLVSWNDNASNYHIPYPLAPDYSQIREGCPGLVKKSCGS